MTVQTSEPTTVAAASCHGHASADEGGHDAHEAHGASAAGTSALGAVAALPRNVKIIGGAVVGVGALLAVGVPFATLTPLLALGGCLGMHLFMGHDMSHGGGHGSHDSGSVASGSGSAEDPSTRTGV
jgi:hypothetical protein